MIQDVSKKYKIIKEAKQRKMELERPENTSVKNTDGVQNINFTSKPKDKVFSIRNY